MNSFKPAPLYGVTPPAMYVEASSPSPKSLALLCLLTMPCFSRRLPSDFIRFFGNDRTTSTTNLDWSRPLDAHNIRQSKPLWSRVPRPAASLPGRQRNIIMKRVATCYSRAHQLQRSKTVFRPLDRHYTDRENEVSEPKRRHTQELESASDMDTPTWAQGQQAEEAEADYRLSKSKTPSPPACSHIAKLTRSAVHVIQHLALHPESAFDLSCRDPNSGPLAPVARQKRRVDSTRAPGATLSFYRDMLALVVRAWEEHGIDIVKTDLVYHMVTQGTTRADPRDCLAAIGASHPASTQQADLSSGSQPSTPARPSRRRARLSDYVAATSDVARSMDASDVDDFLPDDPATPAALDSYTMPAHATAPPVPSGWCLNASDIVTPPPRLTGSRRISVTLGVGLLETIPEMSPPQPTPPSWRKFEKSTPKDSAAFKFSDASFEESQANDHYSVFGNKTDRRKSEPLLQHLLKDRTRRFSDSPQKFFAGTDRFDDVNVTSTPPAVSAAPSSPLALPSTPVASDKASSGKKTDAASRSGTEADFATPLPAFYRSNAAQYDTRSRSSSPATARKAVFNIDMRETQDIFGARKPAAPQPQPSPVQSLAGLVESKCDGDARVVVTHEHGKVIVRFKLPDEFTAIFPKGDSSVLTAEVDDDAHAHAHDEPAGEVERGHSPFEVAECSPAPAAPAIPRQQPPKMAAATATPEAAAQQVEIQHSPFEDAECPETPSRQAERAQSPNKAGETVEPKRSPYEVADVPETPAPVGPTTRLEFDRTPSIGGLELSRMRRATLAPTSPSRMMGLLSSMGQPSDRRAAPSRGFNDEPSSPGQQSSPGTHSSTGKQPTAASSPQKLPATDDASLSYFTAADHASSPSQLPAAAPTSSPSQLPAAVPSSSPSQLPAAAPTSSPSKLPAVEDKTLIVDDFEQVDESTPKAPTQPDVADESTVILTPTQQLQREATEAPSSGLISDVGFEPSFQTPTFGHLDFSPTKPSADATPSRAPTRASSSARKSATPKTAPAKETTPTGSPKTAPEQVIDRSPKSFTPLNKPAAQPATEQREESADDAQKPAEAASRLTNAPYDESPGRDFLYSFISRSRSKRPGAASSAPPSSVDMGTPGPAADTRRPLGIKSPNVDSPSPRKRKQEDDEPASPTKSASDKDRASDSDKPVAKKAKRGETKSCLKKTAAPATTSSTAKTPKPSANTAKTPAATNTRQKTPQEDEGPPRRSTRLRAQPADPPKSSIPMAIKVGRPSVSGSGALNSAVRNEQAELSRQTSLNTRRNKGKAESVQQTLARCSEELSGSDADDASAGSDSAGESRGGKAVSWSNPLASHQQTPPAKKAAKKSVSVAAPAKKKAAASSSASAAAKPQGVTKKPAAGGRSQAAKNLGMAGNGTPAKRVTRAQAKRE